MAKGKKLKTTYKAPRSVGRNVMSAPKVKSGLYKKTLLPDPSDFPATFGFGRTGLTDVVPALTPNGTKK